MTPIGAPVTISRIPTEALRSIWPEVLPHLEKAIALMPGRYDAIDIYTMIAMEELALWGAWERGRQELKANWTTKVYDVPQGRIMTIEWLGGEDVDLWADAAIGVMMQYAKDMGCTRVEEHGREGWAVFAKKYGFKKLTVTYEKEI